jgi:hypothetical protein
VLKSAGFIRRSGPEVSPCFATTSTRCFEKHLLGALGISPAALIREAEGTDDGNPVWLFRMHNRQV